MRLFFLTIFFCCLYLSGTAQTSVNSAVTDVTLFNAGVQISRSASTRLNPGTNTLLLKNISPFAQANTVRVTLEGNATVLSVQYGISIPEDKMRESDIKKNEGFLAQKNEQLVLLRNQLKIVNLEESLLQKNQVQVTGLTNYSLKPAELEEMIGLQTRRNTAVTTQQFNLGKSITAVEMQRDSIKKVMDDLKIITSKPTGELALEVSAAQAGQVKLTINYFVPQSSWQPLYDVRVKDISKPVTLVQRASVYQQTGEEWTNVKMHLSTGDPNINNLVPVIQPWRLRFYNTNARAVRPTGSPGRYRVSVRTAAKEIRGKLLDGDTGDELIGASISAVGTNAGAIANVDGTFVLKIPPEATAIRFSYTGYNELVIPINNARGSVVDVMLGTNQMALAEVVVTGYARSKDELGGDEQEEEDKKDFDDGTVQATVTALPTTLLYDIETPVTLPPDGKPLVLDIQSFDLAATYEHYCVPKLDPQVYLTARITGWDSLGLLSGPTNLFFEGTYLGKSYLEFVTTSDTLVLSLGRDQNVVATRTKMREYSKRRFLSDQKEDSRSFELVFKNKKNVPVHLLVADQIPLSTRKNIEVKSTDYSGAQFNEKTGILEWKMDIKPGGTEKRKMGYVVRYPKYRVVVLE